MPDPSSLVFQNILDSKYFSKADLLCLPRPQRGGTQCCIWLSHAYEKERKKKISFKGKESHWRDTTWFSGSAEVWVWSVAMPVDLPWLVRKHISASSLSHGETASLKLTWDLGLGKKPSAELGRNAGIFSVFSVKTKRFKGQRGRKALNPSGKSLAMCCWDFDSHLKPGLRCLSAVCLLGVHSLPTMPLVLVRTGASLAVLLCCSPSAVILTNKGGPARVY